MELSKIAAVVVLYNPDQEHVLENIQFCSSQVLHTFLIDNSDAPDVGFVRQLKNLQNATYIWNNGNEGIAHALNVGALRAQESGYEWLLTLDQDTALPLQFVQNMHEGSMPLPSTQIGLLAPAYQDSPTMAIEDQGEQGAVEARPVLFTMTSGNLINLQSHRLVGGFMKELFIDHVDHEYCLRLNANGYKVYEIPSVTLKHKPGKEKRFGLRPVSFKYASHNPVRLYYFCRNGFKVAMLYDKQFPRFRRFFRNLLVKEIIKILFFENDKITRMQMIFKGYRDFKTNKFGR
jgi:rhamnosyltransferase